MRDVVKIRAYSSLVHVHELSPFLAFTHLSLFMTGLYNISILLTRDYEMSQQIVIFWFQEWRLLVGTPVFYQLSGKLVFVSVNVLSTNEDYLQTGFSRGFLVYRFKKLQLRLHVVIDSKNACLFCILYLHNSWLITEFFFLQKYTRNFQGWQ